MFNFVFHKMQNALKHFLSLIIVLLSLTSVAQKVDIPDYWFRMYLKYQLPEVMDRNQLDVAKAKAYAGEMDCSNSKIRSLEGIMEMGLILLFVLQIMLS